MSAYSSSNVLQLNQFSLKKAIRSDLPLLVDFWADWCGPCKTMDTVLENLAGEYKSKAVIAKINVEENLEAAREYEISAIPNIKVFSKGQVVEDITGAVPIEDLRKILDSYT